MAEGNNFKETVEALFQGLDSVVTSKTVVGEAIHINGTIILPLVDVSFGIGAGAGCDGQILVYQDMLAMYSDFTPKFVKKYADIGKAMQEGIAAYIDEVRKGAFPAPEHEFKISDQVMEKLYTEGGCAK